MLSSSTNSYVCINDSIIEDENISLSALGVFLHLKNIKNKKGHIYTKDLNFSKKEGKVVLNAIAELLQNGYLAREEIRNNIRFEGYELFLLDVETENTESTSETESKEKLECESKPQEYIDNIPENLDRYLFVWEEKVSSLSEVTGKWIMNVSKKIDIEVFEEAIYEAVSRDIRNFNYIKKIIDNWISDGIKTIDDLNEQRKLRNKYFQGINAKNSKKGSNNYNNINKASKIVPRKEIVELLNKTDEIKNECNDVYEAINIEDDVKKRLSEIRKKRMNSILDLDDEWEW